MPVRDNVEIGLNRFARRGYDLDEVSIVPSRRTRDVDDVSTAWQIDAFRFDIPLVTSPSDAVVSPATAIAVGQAGGLGVLNAEGLWTRYDDPAPVYRRLREAAGEGAPPVALLQEVYSRPVEPDLVTARIKEMRDAGVTTQGDALNLKEFIADLDVPVIVGGAANYQTALHLMRTGAAGVIVGVGADSFSTTDAVMGIRVPLASAADAVQLGEPLRAAAEAPGGGVWWDSVAAHPRLPRGGTSAPIAPAGSLHDVLLGEARAADGRTNLFGALRRTMAKTGYRDLKEFQRVDLVIGGGQ